MRAMKAKLLALVFLLPGLAGAEEIKGEVFIVTKGGTNITLGRVAVRAYDLAEIQKHISERKEAAAPLLEKAQRFEEACKKQSDSGDVLSDAHRKAFEEYLNWGCVAKYLASGLYYFEGLPDPKAEAKTDSAGKYSLDLPPGDYAIAAHGTRAVGRSEEGYYWLLHCHVAVGKALDFTLSNDNLADSDSSDSLVRTISSVLETDAPEGKRLQAQMFAEAKAGLPQQAPTPAEPKMTVEQAQVRAVQAYPDLAVKDSALNAEFVNRVKIYRETMPEFFNDPEWPWILAKQISGAK